MRRGVNGVAGPLVLFEGAVRGEAWIVAAAKNCDVSGWASYCGGSASIVELERVRKRHDPKNIYRGRTGGVCENRRVLVGKRSLEVKKVLPRRTKTREAQKRQTRKGTSRWVLYIRGCRCRYRYASNLRSSQSQPQLQVFTPTPISVSHSTHSYSYSQSHFGVPEGQAMGMGDGRAKACFCLLSCTRPTAWGLARRRLDVSGAAVGMSMSYSFARDLWWATCQFPSNGGCP